MTPVNPNYGYKTELDVFSWHILKFDIIFYWSQNTKIFQ